eukprot:3576749-Pyramimonas_sp.AAC.1
MGSGVLQGCPPSGTLRVITASPFLLDLDRSLSTPSAPAGIPRACADDLGVVMFEDRGYRRLARISRCWKQFANLQLERR